MATSAQSPNSTKLMTARQYIQEKNYTAARYILKTMPNEPTAKVWLKKIDQIAPEVKKPNILRRVSIVLVLLIIGLIFIYTQTTGRITPVDTSSGSSDALAAFYEYCSGYRDLGQDTNETLCRVQVQNYATCVTQPGSTDDLCTQAFLLANCRIRYPDTTSTGHEQCRANALD